MRTPECHHDKNAHMYENPKREVIAKKVGHNMGKGVEIRLGLNLEFWLRGWFEFGILASGVVGIWPSGFGPYFLG